jgi:hypothetical protein
MSPQLSFAVIHSSLQSHSFAKIVTVIWFCLMVDVSQIVILPISSKLATEMTNAASHFPMARVTDTDHILQIFPPLDE